MGRILGVDYGRERVGLAVSDETGVVAQPLEVLERAKRKGFVDAVLAVADELDVSEIVVGHPLRLDGTAGPAAQAVEQFSRTLRERGRWPVVLFDERLSTVEAKRGMRAAGVTERAGRGAIDKVAAAVVLRAYLESNRDPDTELSPILPDPVEREPEPSADREAGGQASAKRRATEKRVRRRSGRHGWRRDLDDA